jgi:hypothetical protein
MFKKKQKVSGFALIREEEYKEFLEFKNTKRLHVQSTTKDLLLKKPKTVDSVDDKQASALQDGEGSKPENKFQFSSKEHEVLYMLGKQVADLTHSVQTLSNKLLNYERQSTHQQGSGDLITTLAPGIDFTKPFLNILVV